VSVNPTPTRGRRRSDEAFLGVARWESLGLQRELLHLGLALPCQIGYMDLLPAINVILMQNNVGKMGSNPTSNADVSADLRVVALGSSIRCEPQCSRFSCTCTRGTFHLGKLTKCNKCVLFRLFFII
jgi:hypothetical protein